MFRIAVQQEMYNEKQQSKNKIMESYKYSHGEKPEHFCLREQSN